MRLSYMVRKVRACGEIGGEERDAELSIKGYLSGVQKALSTWKGKNISKKEKKAIDRIHDNILEILQDID